MKNAIIQKVNNFPPNYDIILSFLPEVKEDKNAIFAYKNTIYNPYHLDITPDRELHEAIHFKQQGNSPDEWYIKYLTNSEFRLAQELEAYGEQYAYVKKVYSELEQNLRKNNKTVHAKQAIEWGLDKMSEALSSNTYGKILSYGEARSKIRNFAKSINLLKTSNE